MMFLEMTLEMASSPPFAVDIEAPRTPISRAAPIGYGTWLIASVGYAVKGSSRFGMRYNATIPIMLVGITVAKVSPAPHNAPLDAVLGSLAANTLSIKSSATMSQSPSARMLAQLTNAPLPMSVRPERSR